MKKSFKPFLVKFLGILLIATTIVLVTIGVRLKYQELTREKLVLEKELNSLETQQARLIALYQQYSSKDRIMKIAREKLGMMKRTTPSIIIEINKELVDRINNGLSSKYE